jgi:hypothetical protein
MAEFKYAVKNGDNILGLMWKVSESREIFVTYGDTLDLNHSLDIRDSKGNDIKEVELIDLLSEILPHVE